MAAAVVVGRGVVCRSAQVCRPPRLAPMVVCCVYYLFISGGVWRIVEEREGLVRRLFARCSRNPPVGAHRGLAPVWNLANVWFKGKWENVYGGCVI